MLYSLGAPTGAIPIAIVQRTRRGLVAATGNVADAINEKPQPHPHATGAFRPARARLVSLSVISGVDRARTLKIEAD
jgi:hypothetical protein